MTLTEFNQIGDILDCGTSTFLVKEAETLDRNIVTPPEEGHTPRSLAEEMTATRAHLFS